MAEVLGIENLKKLLGFSFSLTKQINESGKDDWQWTDAFSFIDEATQIPGIAKSFKEIMAELGDLSEAEKAELEVYVKTEFDIPDDAVEGMIENSILQAVSLIALVKAWASFKK